LSFAAIRPTGLAQQLQVLKALVSYRMIDPGSEWWLHREWYRNSGLGDLLNEKQEIDVFETGWKTEIVPIFVPTTAKKGHGRALFRLSIINKG
jgi:hypothetical protein